MEKFTAFNAKELSLTKGKEILGPLIIKIKEECKEGCFHLIVPENECSDAVRVLLKENNFRASEPNTNNGRKMVTIRWD